MSDSAYNGDSQARTAIEAACAAPGVVVWLDMGIDPSTPAVR
jgi:hypothetical protein